MNALCKTMLLLIAGCMLLIGITGIPSASVGQDPPDPPFTETGYEAYRDNATGLEWGKHINIHSHGQLPEFFIAEFYYVWTPQLDANGNPVLDDEGNAILDPPPGYAFSGGHNDWRPPTITELLTAIEHGLLYDLYGDLSYDPGDQNYGDPKDVNDPDGPKWGDGDYWAICLDKSRGLTHRYKFWFTEDPLDLGYRLEDGGAWILAVRGGPANHSNCPGKHAHPFEEDPASSLAINNVSKKEGNNGDETAFTFTVTRTGDLSASVEFNYETKDDSATSSDDYKDDYEATSGTLVFPHDESELRLVVIVYGDTTHEPHERFLVNISTATAGVTVTDSQGIGTIRNDDRR